MDHGRPSSTMRLEQAFIPPLRLEIEIEIGIVGLGGGLRFEVWVVMRDSFILLPDRFEAGVMGVFGPVGD